MDYFIQYKNEISFIDEHYRKYNTVPDAPTFLSRFNDFEILEVNESDKYLVETLQEQYTYSKLVPCVKKIADLCKTDANSAVDFARKELDNILKVSTVKTPGLDIIQSFEFCSEEYKRRIEIKGLLGISSGIKEIDEATHGWVYPDVVTILGRLNEGKSWLLFLFLINAWKQGVPVLMYSGEMDTMLLQMRFASLHGGFSNLGLMSGKEDLKNGKTFVDFFKYARDVSKNNTPFIVLTPSDLKTQKLTISELRKAIELYRPGIVGIDQLSLMEDERANKSDSLRINYTHLTEDLFYISETHKIPILVAVQAGRAAVDKKENKTPDMEHISESDGIGQNATRTLALKQLSQENRLLLSLRKNRYGLKNQEWKLKWEVDTGDIGFVAFDQSVTPNASIKEGEEIF